LGENVVTAGTVGPAEDTALDPEEQLLKNFRNICRFCGSTFKSKKSVRSSSPEGQYALAALGRFARRIQRLAPIPDGCSALISKGQSNLPSVLWIAITKNGRLVSDGPSVAICFGSQGDGAVVGLMDSATFKSAELTTVLRTGTRKKIIDVDGPKTSYNDRFVNPMEIFASEKSAKRFVEHLRKSMLLLEKHYALKK